MTIIFLNLPVRKIRNLDCTSTHPIEGGRRACELQVKGEEGGTSAIYKIDEEKHGNQHVS